MENIAALKIIQRRQADTARSALSAVCRAEYSDLICRRILSLPQLQYAHTVMSYMAFRAETDMSILHKALNERNIRLCFPVSGPGGHMEAYAPTETQWIVGRYGIREPDFSCAELIRPQDIDLIITPCVAFDDSRHRIGWGGGYYDRFLPLCESAYTVAAAFEVQKITECAVDKYDIALNAVATEYSLY